uniref:Amidohydrolase-related domain-containing protein n=1 Tax=Entomoneis paludosa TaxID=265537 RepID=A0A7S2YKI3_9STRA
MAKHGTYLVPTLLTYDMLKKDGVAQGLAPDMVAKVDDVFEAGKRSIGIAKAHGVKTCFGTDCLSDMRQAQLHQFRLLRDAGMSMLDILQSATCHAAQLVDRQGDLGVVQASAIADLLVVNANPMEDETPVFSDWQEHCFAIVQNGIIRYQQ